jgi:hypothetical protein
MNAVLMISLAWCALAATELQNSYFPIQTPESAEGVTKFESEWYGKSLENMHEPRLPEAAKDVNAEIYRLTILPTWGNPIAVRVQRHGELYSLSSRRLNGQGGYNAGKLIESKDIELDANDSKTLSTLMENLNFFQLPSSDNVRGFDGDEWIIEGVSHGTYHVATRWCADTYGPDKRGLRPFLALCTFLIDKSKLSERPQNRGHKLI